MIGLLSLLLFMQPDLSAWVAALPAGTTASVEIRDHTGAVVAAHNADAAMPSASVIKIPILAVLVKEAEAGRISLDDTTHLRAADLVGGSGILFAAGRDTSLTWRELARLMITVSDNSATNALIRELGMDLVNGYMDTWEMQETRLRRLMMDFEAARAGRENTASAADLNRLLWHIREGRIGSRESTTWMLDVLEACEDRTTIPAGLPGGTRFAHKTGTLDYVRGDSGILFLDGRVLYITAFVRDAPDIATAERLLADLGTLLR